MRFNTVYWPAYGAVVIAMVLFASCSERTRTPSAPGHDHPHPHESGEEHPHPHPEEPAQSGHAHEEDHDHPHPHGSDEEHPHPHPHPEDPVADDAHSHSDDHAERDAEYGHEHGEKTAQATVWTDRFELFVEHPYAVVNTPVQFITHVTDLVTLHPRRDGAVVFVMKSPSGEVREHVERAPARAGIYLPEITFPAAGVWGLSLRIPVDGTEFAVDLPALQVYPDADAAAHALDQETPEGISFLKEQQWKILSKTEPVRRRPLTERLRLSGVVLPVPGKRALVTPPVEGRLTRTAESPLPFIGDEVQEGQTLAVLQPVAASALQSLALDLDVKTAEAEAAIREAEAARDKAERALQRVKDLFEKKAKSAREVEEAEFEYRQAVASHTAAQALLRSVRDASADLKSKHANDSSDRDSPVLPLKAPIDGRIIAVEAAEGEFVTQEKSLFTILDTSTVLIETRVPESELVRIRPELGARFALPGAADDLIPIGSRNSGRFVVLGSEIDPTTRTAPLIYEVPNADGNLRVGLALTVYVDTNHAEDALVVPVSAIVQEEGQAVAFVQLAGETFERRDLTLGIRSGDEVQVLEGLNEGDRVVTKGAYAIRLASVSSVIPAHGHAH